MLQPQDISNLRASRDAALASAMAAEERVRNTRRRDRSGRAAASEGRPVAAPGRARGRQPQGGRRSVGLRAARRRRVCRAQGVADAAAGGDCQQLQRPVAFVLAPVRIETSFAPSPTGPTLRVRFFPDDISLGPPVAAVSDAERALGEAYWRARAASRHAAGDPAARAAYEGAWTALATRAGAYRAGYVVRGTTPANPEAAPGDLPVHRSTPSDPACHRACRSPPGSVRRARLHDGSGDPYAA